MSEEIKDLNESQDVEMNTDVNIQEKSVNDESIKEQNSSHEPVDTTDTVKDETNNNYDFTKELKTFNEGDLVSGVVVHIDKDGVLVDVGMKSEGIIKPGELTIGQMDSAEDIVSVGENIDVIVLQSENEEGNIILSKKRADFEKAWERVQQAHNDNQTVTAMVSDRVKGGLVVDLGIRGFVPGSHVGNGKVKNLDRYIGQSIPLKILEVDKEKRKIILSNRLAIEEEQTKLRNETIKSIKEGSIHTGIVRRLTDYGAFIDLGGIDGLLHISEMSWTRIKHPSEILKVGQKIQIMILKMNLDAERISLGLRQILPDPWSDVEEKYKVGDIVKGVITRIVPFGAFIQLDGKIEAIIPHSEQRFRGDKNAEDKQLNVGDTIEAKIIDIRSEERKMTLSIRQLREDKDRQEYSSYQTARNDEARMTLGDLIDPKTQKKLQDIEANANREDSKIDNNESQDSVSEDEPIKSDEELKTDDIQAPADADNQESEAPAVDEQPLVENEEENKAEENSASEEN